MTNDFQATPHRRLTVKYCLPRPAALVFRKKRSLSSADTADHLFRLLCKYTKVGVNSVADFFGSKHKRV